MRRLLLPSLLLITGTQAAAQTRPTRGDTLRFEQTIKVMGNMDLPTGPQAIDSQVQIFSLVAFLGGDSAVTWIDSTASKSASGPVDMAVAFNQFKGQRITLRILPDGRVQPTPQSLEALGLGANAQLPESRFWLPGRANLQPGATWSDSTALNSAGLNFTSVTRYEVVGDSVFGGNPLTVVKSATTVSSVGGGTGMPMNGKGEGAGRAYFSRRLGVIVQNVATMRMEITMDVGGTTMGVRQNVETSMSLVRR
jgi:hypothetical protein